MLQWVMLKHWVEGLKPSAPRLGRHITPRCTGSLAKEGPGGSQDPAPRGELDPGRPGDAAGGRGAMLGSGTTR